MLSVIACVTSCYKNIATDNNNNDKWKTQHKHTSSSSVIRKQNKTTGKNRVERKALHFKGDVHEFRLEKPYGP